MGNSKVNEYLAKPYLCARADGGTHRLSCTVREEHSPFPQTYGWSYTVVYTAGSSRAM